MGKKLISEQDTIKSILALARKQGVEDKVKRLIIKFQDAVKGAKNEYERKHIAAMGLAEIHKTIGCVGELVVDGCQILPPDLSYKEEIDASKSVVNLN